MFILRKRIDVNNSSFVFEDQSDASSSPSFKPHCNPRRGEETTLALKAHHGLGDGVSICYAFFPTLIDTDQGGMRKMVTSLVNERLNDTTDGGHVLLKACAKGAGFKDSETPLRAPTLLQMVIYVASFLVVPFSYAR